MQWRRRSRQAFESFKRHAQDTKSLAAHRMLSPWAIGDNLVYEVNPVYLEAGQGANSPVRGWGAILFLGALLLAWYEFIDGTVWALHLWRAGRPFEFEQLLLPFGGLLAVVTATVVCGFYLLSSFFSATDIITRYDRKRQKVWMWTGRGVIELDWAALIPVVRSGAATAYFPSRLYRGLYAEFGPDDEPKKTRGIQHIVQVGLISATEEGILPQMEFVRRYMEEDPRSLPPVRRYLQRRPKWWAMINFMGMIQDWIDFKEGKNEVKPSYGTMVFFFLLFPLLFPMQFTNWLALAVSPRPKWPRDLLQMHAQDLAELATEVIPARQSRKPVIRVNGKIVGDGAGPDSSADD